MSVSISIQPNVSPIDATIARLEQIEAIVAKYAGLIEEEAKTLVPVRTGALRDSIVTHLNGLVAEITAGEGLSYAHLIEYGTRGRPAQPYLRPAAEKYADEFAREIAAALGGS
jgi:HK97 gp10 family phage protein